MVTSRQAIDYNTLRSLLFVPTLNDKFIDTAHTRGAHAIILDLEDAIASDQKAHAREALKGAVQRIRLHPATVLARVNNDPALLEEDLRAAVFAGVDGVLIPKVDNSEMLRQSDSLITSFERQADIEQGAVKTLALIESPMGMFNLREIAQASARLVGLGFGCEDFASCMGIEPTTQALSMPAQQLAMVARAFNLAALGIPGSIGDFTDTAGFRQLVLLAKSYGFTGTPGIHPRQITVINEAFHPSAAEIAHARRVLDAFEQARRRGEGAVALDGKMIDLPIVERARRTLDAARRGTDAG